MKRTYELYKNIKTKNHIITTNGRDEYIRNPRRVNR